MGVLLNQNQKAQLKRNLKKQKVLAVNQDKVLRRLIAHLNKQAYREVQISKKV